MQSQVTAQQDYTPLLPENTPSSSGTFDWGGGASSPSTPPYSPLTPVRPVHMGHREIHVNDGDDGIWIRGPHGEADREETPPRLAEVVPNYGPIVQTFTARREDLIAVPALYNLSQPAYVGPEGFWNHSRRYVSSPFDSHHVQRAEILGRLDYTSRDAVALDLIPTNEMELHDLLQPPLPHPHGGIFLSQNMNLHNPSYSYRTFVGQRRPYMWGREGRTRYRLYYDIMGNIRERVPLLRNGAEAAHLTTLLNMNFMHVVIDMEMLDGTYTQHHQDDDVERIGIFCRNIGITPLEEVPEHSTPELEIFAEFYVSDTQITMIPLWGESLATARAYSCHIFDAEGYAIPIEETVPSFGIWSGREETRPRPPRTPPSPPTPPPPPPPPPPAASTSDERGRESGPQGWTSGLPQGRDEVDALGERRGVKDLLPLDLSKVHTRKRSKTMIIDPSVPLCRAEISGLSDEYESTLETRIAEFSKKLEKAESVQFGPPEVKKRKQEIFRSSQSSFVVESCSSAEPNSSAESNLGSAQSDDVEHGQPSSKAAEYFRSFDPYKEDQEEEQHVVLSAAEPVSKQVEQGQVQEASPQGGPYDNEVEMAEVDELPGANEVEMAEALLELGEGLHHEGDDADHAAEGQDEADGEADDEGVCVAGPDDEEAEGMADEDVAVITLNDGRITVAMHTDRSEDEVMTDSFLKEVECDAEVAQILKGVNMEASFFAIIETNVAPDEDDEEQERRVEEEVEPLSLIVGREGRVEQSARPATPTPLNQPEDQTVTFTPSGQPPARPPTPAVPAQPYRRPLTAAVKTMHSFESLESVRPEPEGRHEESQAAEVVVEEPVLEGRGDEQHDDVRRSETWSRAIAAAADTFVRNKNHEKLIFKLEEEFEKQEAEQKKTKRD